MAPRQWTKPSVVTSAVALPPAKRERIKELIREGLTYVVVAQRLGLHVNTVWAWVMRLELRPAPTCARCGARRFGCRGHSFEGRA